jgi:hypothetical protein
MPYQVLDRDGKLMGTYGTKKGAERKKDTLDNEHGGYRYRVQIKASKKKTKKDLKIKKA